MLRKLKKPRRKPEPEPEELSPSYRLRPCGCIVGPPTSALPKIFHKLSAKKKRLESLGLVKEKSQDEHRCPREIKHSMTQAQLAMPRISRSPERMPSSIRHRSPHPHSASPVSPKMLKTQRRHSPQKQINKSATMTNLNSSFNESRMSNRQHNQLLEKTKEAFRRTIFNSSKRNSHAPTQSKTERVSRKALMNRS